MGESSSNPADVEEQAPTTKSRRLNFDVRNRSLMPVKYVNLISFPEHSFSFPAQLKEQGVDKLVSEVGSYYPDLVKEVFTTLQIGKDEFEDHMIYAKVRNFEISKDMDSFGTMLGIPDEGEFIYQGFQPNDGEWEHYSKMDFYFQICRGSQADVLSGKNLSSSRIFCYAKNLTVSDWMLHYIIAYVLLSKNSNHYQINDVEMQLIYAIKKNIKVN